MSFDPMPTVPPPGPPAPAGTAQTVPPHAGWQFTPHVIIFFSSACVMIVELVAGRLIARHLGSSLYTWTSIIGVVLAGMSIGNWIGGRLADRWQPKAFLGWLFMIASAACVLALVTNYFFSNTTGDQVSLLPHWLTDYTQRHLGKWVARIVLAVVTIFLPPAIVLGTISPATAKLALDRSKRVGSTIGSVYAWGAFGSILGTFATGFYLIAMLGATGMVLTTALGLATIGLFLGPARWAHAAWVLLLAAGLFLAKGPVNSVRDMVKKYTNQTVMVNALDRAEVATYQLGLREGTNDSIWDPKLNKYVPGPWRPYPFGKEGKYQFVRVEDERHAGRNMRVLYLDYLLHGYVDREDPTFLRYDYEHVYRDVARRYYQASHTESPDRKTVDSFFIGGGAYAFQRWVLAEWPGSSVDVAEIDPLVLEANYVATGLDRDTPIRTFIGDARNVVDDLPASRKYDFIFGDAFADLSVPFHLTTLEFSRKVAAHLKPDGAYLVNIIDDFKYGQFLGAYVLTLQEVFKHVYVFCTRIGGVTTGRDTFVVAASNVPLYVRDLENPAEAGPPGGGEQEEAFPGSLLTAADLGELARKAKGRILTDDNAPVENLLQDVVRTRGIDE